MPTLARATGIVTGKVVDPAGNPKAGILLKLAPKEDTSLPTYKIKTNKKGVYLFRAENGSYLLTLEDESYGMDKVTVQVRDEQRRPLPDWDWSGRIAYGQSPPEVKVRSRFTFQLDIQLQTLEALKAEYSRVLLVTIAKQLDSGESEKARETVETLLQNSPGDPLGLTLRAHIRVEDGDLENAENDLNSALESDPEFEDAKYLLGTIYHKTGRTDQASEILRALAESSSNPDISGKAWLSIAEFERDADNPEKRLAALEKAAEASPDLKPMIAPEIAAIYSSLGQADKAEEWLGATSAEEESDPTVLYNIAVGHFNANQYEEAIAGFRKVVEAKPEFAEAYRDLGWALVNQGQMDEAKQSFGKYLELSPDASDAEEIKGIVEALGG
jgi:tetratricopeptide (TPR) repeat protein